MWEFAVLGALAAGSGMVWAFGENRKILNGWREAVESCGLRIDQISGSVSLYFRLDASDGPIQVRIRATRQKNFGGLRVVIRFDGPPGFSEIRIRKEVGGVQRKLREIELGDPAFDQAFLIQGPIRLVSALLDAETRRLLLDIHEACRGVEIGEGEIRAEMLPVQLGILMPLMMDAARRLARPMEVRSRLAENARQDPESGVRLQNVLLLAREQPEAADSLAALHLACSDPSPWVRLGAAVELGPAGRETLLQLADTRGDDALSAKAVTHLGRGLPFERAHELLVASLRWRRLNTARACLQAIAASGVAGAVEILAGVLDRESGDLAAAAALALGAVGDPGAEPALIRALGNENADIPVAAAQALGRVGTADAVLPLKEAAARRDADLRRAARQAIAEIQSRLPGASQGQLSLAQAEAGQLSIAEAEAGQLSVADSTSARIV
jgi:HEAT repeat protein